MQPAVEITGLPTLVVRQMWTKAIDLVSTTGHVLPAPGSCSMSRMVAHKGLTLFHAHLIGDSNVIMIARVSLRGTFVPIV